MKNVFYELFMSILALLSASTLLLNLFGKLGNNNIELLWINYITLAMFIFDYIFFLILSNNKTLYFKTHIIELIAIIPFTTFFRFFRLFKLFHVLKIFRLIRSLSFLALFYHILHKFLRKNGFIYVLFTVIVLILIASVIECFVDKNTIHNMPDAIWWSIVTLTTVGYGHIAPKTIIGRVVAIILMFSGIGFISYLTGTIVSFFSEIAIENQSYKNIEVFHIDNISPTHKIEMEIYYKMLQERDRIINNLNKDP